MAPMKSVLSCGRPYTPTHYDFVLVRGAPYTIPLAGNGFTGECIHYAGDITVL